MQKRNLAIFVVLMLAVVLSTAGNAQIDLREPINLDNPGTIALTPSDSAYLNQWYRGLSDSGKVKRAWLHTKSRNSYTHPDPDLVLPGDEVLTPMGTYCIAQPGGARHMWRAAERFVATIVQPYFAGTLLSIADNPADTTNVVDTAMQRVLAELEVSDTDMPWWVWLIFLGVVSAIYLAIKYLGHDKKQADDSAARARQQQERDRKFIPDPPDFRTAADDEASRTAAQAARCAFGKGVSIVGNIERGHITGEQVMFNADGTSRTEHFQNEPGYRATVRFPNGIERWVVCRWRCFNPVYSIADAEFNGTFRPEGASGTQDIPAITSEQTKTLESAIAGSANQFTADDLPEADTADAQSEAGATTEPESVNPEDATIMEVAETQISTGRVTIKGFKGTVGQYERVVNLTTGHSLASETGNDNPSKK